MEVGTLSIGPADEARNWSKAVSRVDPTYRMRSGDTAYGQVRQSAHKYMQRRQRDYCVVPPRGRSSR